MAPVEKRLTILSRRFDLVEGYGLAPVFFGRLDAEQRADCHVAICVLVNQPRKFAVLLLRIAANGVLQRRDGRRCPDMRLAAQPIGVVATDIEGVAQDRRVAERVAMSSQRLLGDFGEVDTFDGCRRAREVALDKRTRQSDRVENLRAAVRLIGRDAHLGHDLENALVDGLDVAVNDFLFVHFFRKHVLVGQQGIEGEPRIDRLGAIAGEHAEMVNLARVAGLDDQTDRGPQSLADQMMMDAGGGEQGGDRRALGRNVAVGQNDDVVAAVDRCLGALAKPLDGVGHAVQPRSRPGR